MSFRFSDLLLRAAYRRKASVLSVYTTFVTVSPNGCKIGFICEAEQWRKLSTQRLGQFSGPSQCEGPYVGARRVENYLTFLLIFFEKICYIFFNFFSKIFSWKFLEKFDFWKSFFRKFNHRKLIYVSLDKIDCFLKLQYLISLTSDLIAINFSSKILMSTII